MFIGTCLVTTKTLKLVHALCSGTLSGSQVPSLQIVHLPLQGVNAELIPPESLVQDAAVGKQLARAVSRPGAP